MLQKEAFILIIVPKYYFVGFCILGYFLQKTIKTLHPKGILCHFRSRPRKSGLPSILHYPFLGGVVVLGLGGLLSRFGPEGLPVVLGQLGCLVFAMSK